MVWVGPAVHSGHTAHLLKNEDAWAKGTSTEPGAWTGAWGLPCETTDPKVSFGGHRSLCVGGWGWAWGHSHGYLSVGMDHVGAWVRVSSSVWQGGNGASTVSLGGSVSVSRVTPVSVVSVRTFGYACRRGTAGEL